MLKRKILITGGLGLVGKSLIELLKEKYKVIILDKGKQIKRHKNYINSFKNKNLHFYSCDILNKAKLEKLCRGKDVVIHLAAMLGVKNTENNKNMCWQVNAIGTKNVVDACIKNNVKKLIFTSSSEVYGEQPSTKKISENNPLLGTNIYALSKIASENFIQNLLDGKTTKFTILRLFNTYGAGQVAQFFISKLCYSAINKKLMKINGSGNQIRSYAYSTDISKGIEKCIKNRITNNKIYNLGNSKEIYSLRDVVKIMSEQINNKLKVKYMKKFVNTDRIFSREIFWRVCKISKAKREINFNPKIDLLEGLKLMLNQKKIYLNWPV